MRTWFRGLVLGLAAVGGLGGSGCTADAAGEEEEVVALSQDELSRQLVCSVAGGVAAGAAGAAVQLGIGTGVCVGGTIVTVGGTLACAVPLSGAAASALAAVTAGGVPPRCTGPAGAATMTSSAQSSAKTA
jgi:hypothetical protein